VTLGQVLRVVEEDFQIVECFGDTNMCRISEACRLKHALRRALDAFLAELDEWTLADILSNRNALLSELRPFMS
jgi:Rrf2 family nitric oxide-sensitive transcriptional repressor